MYHIAAYQNSIGEQPSGPEEEILSPSSNHRRNQLSGRPFPQTGVRSHWFYKQFLKWDFLFIFCWYFIQHCFICWPSDFTASEDAGIEPRTVATSACQLSGALTTRQEHILISARPHPLYCKSDQYILFVQLQLRMEFIDLRKHSPLWSRELKDF